MIYKILLTIGVIVVVALLYRNKRSAADQAGYANQAPQFSVTRPVRIAAITTVVVMLASAILWVVLSWRDATTVVTVTVVNSSNGSETSYQAHRGDIDERSFRTIDGRTVVLAEVERMELK